ncbi:MAG: RidA family protein [Clostridia bacterium]|nr:RidA family protein [Clostridia bacterium]MBR2472555.1 RidA family protein [Clostridia bacterium]
MKTKISTTKAPAAIGPYSQGVDLGNMVFTSGQLGIDMSTGALPEGVEAQAKCSLENIKSILAEAGLGMENIIKTVVFIKDMNDFAKVNAIYSEYINGDILPARSCVEVARLPKDALVEIEAIAVR